MNLLTGNTSLMLWHEVITNAEKQCSLTLNQDLEAYLISLLMRYSNKPEIAQRIFAQAFLEAMQQNMNLRNTALQHVGDECLLYAGLFPQQAKRHNVKISYFVDLGRAAYAAISNTANDLYWSLAYSFVMLMDVLQSIRQTPDLLPIEAYEQWDEVGSQHAYKVLQLYTGAIPAKHIKR
jgi:hypothetical protein